VTITQKSVAGVSVADGAVLWQHPWAPDMPAISPVLYGEAIIVSVHNMGVTALKPVKRNGKWVTEVVWETKDVSMFMSNPVLIGDTLFGLSHRASGQFFALDAKTGKVLWLGQPRASTNTARSGRTGSEPLKRYTIADSATWAQPAISGNRVFVKDFSSLALWTIN
jgi:outer membrane protein assembly factor BamB